MKHSILLIGVILSLNFAPAFAQNSTWFDAIERQ